MKKIKINNELSFSNDSDIKFILGPCQIESQSHALDVCEEITRLSKKLNFKFIYKSSFDKANRTSDKSFRGLGIDDGLSILSNVKKETGLLIATEVANSVHVDLALKHDVDILWIGARTTVSPFIIQDTADAMKGSDKTVLRKNPVNPDLALWLGAVERFYTADIKNLGVIHRGFSNYEKSKYRNNPEWQIAIELQNKFQS